MRNELLTRLEQKCGRKEATFGEDERELFFGIYAGNIDEFKFMRGERLQILEIVRILKEDIEKVGEEQFKENFETPKNFKVTKCDVSDLSVGLYYGKRPSKRFHKASLARSQNPEEMALQLLPKLKQLFQSFELKQIRPVNEGIINIVKSGTLLRADVICVFCPMNDEKVESLIQRYGVQMDKAGFWNTSNLKKHLKKHTNGKNTEQSGVMESGNDFDHVFDAMSQQSTYSKIKLQLSTPKNENEQQSHQQAANDQVTTFSHDATAINAMSIFFEDDKVANQAIASSDLKTLDLLYQQFSAQNLRLLEATLKNNEKKKYMVSKADARVINVCVINVMKDGNCLFSSLAHQLHCIKMHSIEHAQLTAKLRVDVVSHIMENLDDYKQALKSHLTSECIEKTEKEFVSVELPKNGVWGGTETLLAVQRIYKVNILVFDEQGPYYFATGYDAQYIQTLFVAYRFDSKGENGNPIYNHYESICELNEELLYTCAEELGSKIDKHKSDAEQPKIITLE